MSPEQYVFDVDSFLSPKEIDELNNAYYSTYYLPFLKKGNNLLKEQFVLSCLAADQTARYAAEAHNFDTISSHFILETDSFNLDTLRKFIKTFGFIADSEHSSACHFEILLLHLLRYNDPFLDSCVKVNCRKGIIFPDVYCFYKDQLAADKKETVYGYASFNGTTEPYPIKDPGQTDRLRKEIGYPSLYEEFLRYPNKKLPDNYKPDPGLIQLYAPILKDR